MYQCAMSLACSKLMMLKKIACVQTKKVGALFSLKEVSGSSNLGFIFVALVIMSVGNNKS